MRYLRLIGLLGICLFSASFAHAQRVTFGVGIGAPAYYGPAPVCAYGYYDYYPYACAPYGFYGPDYFVGGPDEEAADVAITGADTATAAVGIMAAAAMATTVAADTDADSIVAIAAETSTAATASVAVVTSAVAESSTAGTASTAAESPMVAAVSTAEAAALTAVATVVDDTKSPTTLRLERADALVCRPFHFSLDSHNRISYTPIHINLCSSGRQLPLFCCPSAHFRC